MAFPSVSGVRSRSAKWRGSWGVLAPGRPISWIRDEILAETEGFEPSVQMYPYDGLANRWFQPLTHVSVAAFPRDRPDSCQRRKREPHCEGRFEPNHNVVHCALLLLPHTPTQQIDTHAPATTWRCLYRDIHNMRLPVAKERPNEGRAIRLSAKRF